MDRGRKDTPLLLKDGLVGKQFAFYPVMAPTINCLSALSACVLVCGVSVQYLVCVCVCMCVGLYVCVLMKCIIKFLWYACALSAQFCVF